MRVIRLVTVVFVSLFFLSCNQVEWKKVTLFHTNDLHSHLFPDPAHPFGLGGLARMTTLLRTLRAKAERPITLDAGDWSEGSFYFNVDGGANMLQAMSILGMTSAVFGNHDYLNGPDEMLRVLDRAKPSFPVLAGNFDVSQYANAEEFLRKVPKYSIHEVDGVKIGVIGMTCFELLYNSYVAPLILLNPIDSATAIAKQIRDQVDLLVVVSHNTFEVNLQLAKLVPGIDAVVSGHSHKKVSQASLVKNAGKEVPVVETGEWGHFVGELQMEVDQKSKAVRFANYQLHPVSNQWTEAEDMVQFTQRQNELLQDRYGVSPQQVVAQADFDLRRADHQESPLGNLVTRAYLDSVSADLALEQISLTGVQIPKGEVTVGMLHDAMPHIYNPKTGREWELLVWKAKASDLSKIIEVLYTVSGLMPLSSPLGWLTAYPVDLRWDLQSGKLSQVTIHSISGQPFDSNRTYRVAMSEGFMDAIRQANALLGLGIDLSQVEKSGLEAAWSVVRYGQKVGQLRLADLKLGNQFRTTHANPAIFYTGVKATSSSSFEVQVESLGLEDSRTIGLKCEHGLVNDVIRHGTDEQVWTEFASVRVDDLPAGATSKVEFSLPEWMVLNSTTRVPVRCQVNAEHDAYLSDSQFEVVL